MLNKVVFSSLIAFTSLVVFAQSEDSSKEVQQKMDMEKLSIHIEAQCKEFAKGILKGLRSVKENKDDSEVAKHLRTLSLSEKRMLSQNIDCATIVKDISQLQEELGPDYMPLGFFKVAGKEINSPPVTKGKIAASIDARGAIGLGMIITMNDMMPRIPKLAAVAIGNVNVTGHAATKSPSVVGEEAGNLYIFSPTGEFKSINSVSSLYWGGVFDTGIANNKQDNTSKSTKILIPATSNGNWSDVKLDDLLALNLKEFATKVALAISGRKPILVMRTIGKGNDADTTQFGPGAAFVHMQEVELFK